ncbi:hypothetical protein CAOG_01410 [Capsaspora owczarzaki ATCC 30864]|uniref:Uncharacterized protein n=1 Tax=Capsaspora owczarzaki (strain ATCC 30864) TaxID=595528 RepID=A0A0D2X117_CAPO3|nr:hypothetical protein CAOG_01410 [Capsaspora owczarzaki ATCC 30864]KJE90029.1 hypothetical protein CAOG_001410 [Capsaspora owczarzaki ATCC 30864]|eukprot:XP_004349930.1 hypothetical protein CAOG_01410 [Capsaspora owczarzaki ATCC 30864]
MQTPFFAKPLATACLVVALLSMPCLVTCAPVVQQDVALGASGPSGSDLANQPVLCDDSKLCQTKPASFARLAPATANVLAAMIARIFSGSQEHPAAAAGSASAAAGEANPVVGGLRRQAEVRDFARPDPNLIATQMGSLPTTSTSTVVVGVVIALCVVSSLLWMCANHKGSSKESEAGDAHANVNHSPKNGSPKNGSPKSTIPQQQPQGDRRLSVSSSQQRRASHSSVSSNAPNIRATRPAAVDSPAMASLLQAHPPADAQSISSLNLPNRGDGNLSASYLSPGAFFEQPGSYGSTELNRGRRPSDATVLSELSFNRRSQYADVMPTGNEKPNEKPMEHEDTTPTLLESVVRRMPDLARHAPEARPIQYVVLELPVPPPAAASRKSSASADAAPMTLSSLPVPAVPGSESKPYQSGASVYGARRPKSVSAAD